MPTIKTFDAMKTALDPFQISFNYSCTICQNGQNWQWLWLVKLRFSYWKIEDEALKHRLLAKFHNHNTQLIILLNHHWIAFSLDYASLLLICHNFWWFKLMPTISNSWYLLFTFFTCLFGRWRSSIIFSIFIFHESCIAQWNSELSSSRLLHIICIRAKMHLNKNLDIFH